MELLVVIAIIGLLASVVLASLSNARTKSKNSSRAQQVKQYISALELYRADKDIFPSVATPATGGWTCLGDYPATGCWGAGIDTDTGTNNFKTQITPYITSFPRIPDLQSGANTYGGIYRQTLTGGYQMRWLMEGGAGASGYCQLARTSSSNFAGHTSCVFTYP